jgi:Arc/MetJ-type ribon-helix-helix transcriptional regulator
MQPVQPSAGGFNDASDAINGALTQAKERDEQPSAQAVRLFQDWIDGAAYSDAVRKELVLASDIRIFDDAHSLWLEFGDCGL